MAAEFALEDDGSWIGALGNEAGALLARQGGIVSWRAVNHGVRVGIVGRAQGAGVLRWVVLGLGGHRVMTFEESVVSQGMRV